MAALGQFIILLVFSGMTMKIFYIMTVLKDFRRYVMTSSKDIILTSIPKMLFFSGVGCTKVSYPTQHVVLEYLWS